jgi:deferrochelatase/peroxidase EfeB
MARTLQEGIYYQPGARPGLFFTIAFLGLVDGATAQQVRDELQKLWTLYQGLKHGSSPDCPDNPVPSGNLTTMVAYGPNLFEVKGTATIPDELGPKSRFLSPQSIGGGPLLTGSGLAYSPDVSRNTATEAVAVQFIADTQLAAYRAVMETWAFFARSPSNASPGLRFNGFFDGFSRDDGRSWIGFHDGISNMRSGLERENAIRIKTGPNVNGSTLCFLRLEVDLPAWHQRSREEQELLVGRDKFSGCPFSHQDAQGKPVVADGCPLPGTREILQPGNENYRMPSSVPPVAVAVRQSHVQRANLAHRTDTDVSQSLRIFRQGYEFMEALPIPPGFRAGLNFVSFQDTPSRLISILTRQDWMGGANFGGDITQALPGMSSLLKVRAAGIYMVPALDDSLPFPGAEFFTQIKGRAVRKSRLPTAVRGQSDE